MAPDEKMEAAPVVDFTCVKPQMIFSYETKASEAASFYEKVFGAEIVWSTMLSWSPTWLTYSGEMRIGSTVLIVRDVTDFDVVILTEQWTGVSLRVETDDAVGAVARAVHFGCKIEREIQDDKLGFEPLRTRVGQVRDPFGVIWTISEENTQLGEKRDREGGEESSEAGAKKRKEESSSQGDTST